MSKANDAPAKVTSLHGQRVAKKGPTRARTIMGHCEGQLREHMREAIPSIMDQVDDSLFDLSNKADTNQLQSTYFEAMRSVRLRREQMEKSFLEELGIAVSKRMAPASSLEASLALREPDASTFTLVAQDELEESIAVKNIAGKIRNVCHEELFALDRRVALLLSTPNLEGADNPLGAEVLSNAARGAMSAIDANLEVRLLVLKLFERHLTRAAEKFYCEINDWLARQGVLRDVRAAAVSTSQSRAREHQRANGSRGSAPRGQAGGGQGAFHEGAGLVGYHGSEATYPAGPDTAYGDTHGAIDGARGELLLGVLEQVMRVGGGEGSGPMHGVPERERFIGDLTQIQRSAPVNGAGGANLIRELKDSGVASGVSHVDGLMIDVVAMMFDYILQDRTISDGMRALIGRLQIPVLKVAILDKGFFARRSHPARVFINTLAEFGSRASDGEREPTFVKVRELVERILDEFELELDVFGGALAELESILAEEEEEAQRNAWSTSKVAEERERLAAARRRVAQEVDSRLEEHPAPESVVTFLQEHWRHLLAERLFRSGEESDEWRAGIVTMDRLLWSVQPKRDAQSRERLLALLPFLLEQLKLGMHEIGLAAGTRAPFLRALSDMHVAVLRGDAAERPVAGDLPATENQTAHACVESHAAVKDLVAETPREPDVQALLRESVVHANAMVWQTASERPQCQGMGATVVAVKLDGDRLVCAHAGDSRLYRLRNGALEQITRDHTQRQEVMDRGVASAEEAAQIASNVITRAVGGDAAIDVEVNIYDMRAGDLYLACSDGLSDMLDDGCISALLTPDTAADDLESTARHLIDGANAAGGRDNISVGLLRIDAASPDAHQRDYSAQVSVHVATDPGRRRAHNEDAIDADAASGALVLADGMGGHNAGEVASARSVKLIMEALCHGERRDTETQDADGFDFESINAVFWHGAADDEGNTALYEAVAQEVEDIVLASQDDLDACFDITDDDDTQPGAAALDAESDPLLERVLKLTPGTWVEFGDVAGSGARARLSWVAPGQGRFLFTDRYGQKVSDSTPHGLAVELRRGRMRVLDAIPLFDRMVSKVTHTLRSPGGGIDQNVA